MSDLNKIRREGMRWNLLSTLEKMSPVQVHERQLLEITQAIYVNATALEMRRELDYLADRELVTLIKQPSGAWFADLTRFGTDIAQYTIDCDPGIARPPKVWED